MIDDCHPADTPRLVPAERPMNRAAKAALILSAAAAILLFYAFVAGALLLLGLLLGCELLVTLAAARVGMAGFVAKYMGKDVTLATILVRCFFTGSTATFRLPLEREDAPGLFAILDSLSGELKVAMPRVVFVEMTTGAWVELKGYRSGTGTTKLGVGYDLLAGLSEAEVEAVLAHEMVHAKLIHRGLQLWLKMGFNHAATLTRALSSWVETHRRKNETAGLAGFYLRIADSITRTAARLVSTYSRQEEFAADRGAAAIYGAAAISSALLKLDPIHAKAVRLPWRERVAQLQLEGGFSQWLTSELVVGDSVSSSEERRGVFDRYSTHPILNDRLAALTPDNKPLRPSRPAIQLLTNPDSVAGRLIEEIQRSLEKEERKDFKQMQRWVGRLGRGTAIHPSQLPGGLMFLAGVVWGIAALANDLGAFALLCAIPMAAIGFFLYRLGGYKDRIPLPVPSFTDLQKAWTSTLKITELQAAEKQIEAELKDRMAAEKKPRRKFIMLRAESYTSLQRCDYLRAHVAARLGLAIERKSVECTMALAIASAGLKLGPQTLTLLGRLRQSTAMKSRSTSWGGAWAFLLLGDWFSAEALLVRSLQMTPATTTFQILLAFCQAKRGKLHNASTNARTACDAEPANDDYAKLLINTLLDGGHLRQAHDRLEALRSKAQSDSELAFLFVRLNVLSRRFDEAECWVALLQQESAESDATVRLGGVYELARNYEKATEYYLKAVADGYYPEAFLGLARLAFKRKDFKEAHKYSLSALDTVRSVKSNGRGPLDIFPQTLAQLVALEEVRPDCRAWIATFRNKAPLTAVANRSFMVFAPQQEDAERYLRMIVEAMQPNSQPFSATTLHWEPAPADQQPARPVRPGVQYVLA